MLRISRSRFNLFLDAGLALVFVLTISFRLTRLRTHELLGLGFGAAISVHITLHWRWIYDLTRRFFARLFHTSRLNYILNLVLFIDVVVCIVTGIIISRTLGLEIPMVGAVQAVAHRLHVLTSSLSLLLVGLHIALHWRWIIAHTRRYVYSPELPWREVDTAQNE